MLMKKGLFIPMRDYEFIETIKGSVLERLFIPMRDYETVSVP